MNKDQLTQKAIEWYIGVPQNGSKYYQLTREQVLQLLVDFHLHMIEQKSDHLTDPGKMMTAEQWLKSKCKPELEGMKGLTGEYVVTPQDLTDYAAYVSEIKAREAFEAARIAHLHNVLEYDNYEDYRKEANQ